MHASMLNRCTLSRWTGKRKSGLRGKHTLHGEKYQYLQKSEIPSYHFQKSLRRLPIPKLANSCNRYLAAARPVLSPSFFAEAEKLVRDFEKTDGIVLQEALVAYDKANKSTSYITDSWFDIYLKARVPLPVNYNPFMMYAPDPDKKYNHQLTRATNLAISYARFKRALDSEVLAPEVYHLNPKKSDTKIFRTVCKMLPPSLSWFGAVLFKAFPLDMSQYKSLFNGTRIPKKNKDVIYNDPSAKHFLAIHKGRLFAVRLLEDNGNILPAVDVHASLAWVLEQKEKGEGLGSLTTLERDEWAGLREQLLNEGNQQALKDVDGAMFALCLDDIVTEDHKRLVESLLVGDDGSNRWFDKSFALVVDGNGMATLNFEHSWGDGVAVMRLMEESFADTNKNHFVHPDTKAATVAEGNVKEIKFNVSDSMREAVAAARRSHVERFADLDFHPMEYRRLNRDSIKKYKLSPDSFMQLAIQMAFYSLNKEFVPTYESCSTAAFLKGRTECMRSATSATRAATLAIVEEEKSAAEVKELLKQCSSTHSQLAKEASMGEGFDRHMLGLRITAERIGRKQHPLFTSAAHAQMGNFVLSTSTLSTETIVFGGFGPVVKEGFGIGYNVVPSLLGAVITSYKSHRSSTEFAMSLEKSLDKLKQILEH